MFVLAAVAAPEFIADVPADADVARRAWQAALTCTGWEPETHPRVALQRGHVEKGFLGLASADAKGLFQIELDASSDRLNEVIVHEVAHAWVRRGPTALVEGRAELLADCMVHEQPGLAPLQWDDGRELAGMPDLQSWRSDDDHGPSVNPLMRTDSYLGASRMVRVASLVLPARALWPESDDIDWKSLDAMLADAGEPGAALREVLAGDGETQRRALSDVDKDGLPLVGERMFGTDPNVFDSDGDGWWDGAAVPVDAIPLPFDGTPVCSGWATAGAGGVAVLKTGGNLRGTPAPRPALRLNDEVFDQGRVAVLGRASILVEMEGESSVVSGGIWARVQGDALVRDTACETGERHVVWAADGRFREVVQPFAHALVEAVARADERLGKHTRRVAVQLGGTSTRVEGPVIRLSAREVRQAMHRKDWAGLANQAVAMRSVWDSSSTQRDWRDVEAVARMLGAAR